MAKRGVIIAASTAAIALAGCADPYGGGIDPLRTSLLGAGAGAGLFGIGGLLAQNQQSRYYAPQQYFQPHGYGGGYGHGYGGSGYGGGYGYRQRYQQPPMTGPFFGYGRGYAPPPGVAW